MALILNGKELSDVTAGVDKIFTVPASELWADIFLWAELTTDATAGNRTVTVEIRNAADDVIYTQDGSVTPAPSTTTSFYINPDNGDPAVPSRIPLPAGTDIRVFVSAGAGAGDTLDVKGIVGFKQTDVRFEKQ